MSSFNKVILLGNLTRDPEMSFLPSGKAVANIAMAVNKKWRDEATGEIKEKVNYVDIVAYGKNAENCGKYLRKGDAVLIDGELNQRRWDDKDTGAKRSKMEVIAKMVTFMPKRQGAGYGVQGSGGGVPDKVKEAFAGAQEVDEGDIPF